MSDNGVDSLAKQSCINYMLQGRLVAVCRKLSVTGQYKVDLVSVPDDYEPQGKAISCRPG